MTSTLRCERVADGVEFWVRDGPNLKPLEEWAAADRILTGTGREARVGVLLRLVDDGVAEPRADSRVFLGHRAIASLDDAERSRVGLPQAAEVALELRATAAFSDPEFRIERQLLSRDGRAIVAPSLDGCFLRIGSTEWVLPEPLLSIWEAVGKLNSEALDFEGRLCTWGRIQDQLPENVRLGEELESIRIVVATAFSLNPFRNENGEPDFDPVLGRWDRTLPTAEPNSERTFTEAIPAARQRDFARRFRELSSVKPRYVAGPGHFIVLDDRLREALEVVHKVQRADPGTRRRFLTRPSAFLRDALHPAEGDGAEPRDDETSVDEVFFDEGLSERVKGIGVWQPKVLPWLKPSGESWFPEDSGLRIEDELVNVTPQEAPGLLAKVREARAEGAPSVEHKGQLIPATPETEKALEELIAASAPENGTAEEDTAGDQPPRERLALLIIDNLEQLGFRLPPRATRIGGAKLPTSLRTPLLDHQREGVRWLQEHWAAGSPGALLADDMGLGKTLQAMAFLAWLGELMREGGWPRRPFLVVAPTGLLRNWRDEHEKHFEGSGIGELLEAYGAGLRSLRSARDVEGRELTTGLPSLDAVALARADWVMTTYETLRDYQHSFARVRWGVVVFDEAQKIKNPAAGLTDAAKAMNQDFTVAMTGTPVENRIEDLWCIVDGARPGSLGALKDFSVRFRGDSDGDSAASLAALRNTLLEGSPAVMLRRLKEDHLEGLPEKHVHIHKRAMPTKQARAYADVVSSARTGAPMLQVLQRLRSVSLHPGESESAPDQFIADSARISLAFEILDDVHRRGEKVLIFVESRDVQDRLIEVLQRRYQLAKRLLVINGDVSGTHRKQRVDEFEARPGFDAMILSPRAGGVGLTLTAANHVIHLARWWNPAVEDQCTDRVYRIGQERSVHVHHVLAVHPELDDRSFDLRLGSLLDRKRELNRTVLAPTAASQAELQELYRSTIPE